MDYKPINELSVLGTCNIDFISQVSNFAGPDEEVNINSLHQSLGGSGANFAVHMAREGFKTKMLARIGNDYWGQLLLQELNKEGVNTDLVTVMDADTGKTFISVDGQGERSIYAYMGANAHFELNKGDLNSLNSTSHLHLTGMYIEVVEEAAQQVKSLSFNPGGLLSSFGIDKLQSTLENTKILFLNIKEVKILTGLEVDKGIKLLLNSGVSSIVITRGHMGASYHTNDDALYSKALKVDVVDTTGAGDAFAAGFIAQYLKRKKPEECLKEGHRIAAQQIQSWGGV